MMTNTDYYGSEMTARREKFNRIINGIDMVLMNNIPNVDDSVWENWQNKSPMVSDDCEIDEKDGHWYCEYHADYCDADIAEDKPERCEASDNDYAEVHQWFAINDNDADYLLTRNQYVTYSDMLDTYFLAICHFGTSWDYVDSMVNDILGDS